MPKERLSVMQQFEKSFTIVKSKIENAMKANPSWDRMESERRKVKAKRKLAYAYVDVENFKTFIKQNESLTLEKPQSVTEASRMIEEFLTKNRANVTQGLLNYVHKVKYDKYMKELRDRDDYDRDHKSKQAQQAKDTQRSNALETST
tara:strand:+ start:250 stop:690 length:441 start_codon:yes stop_codon:yes gene_type:complete